MKYPVLARYRTTFSLGLALALAGCANPPEAAKPAATTPAAAPVVATAPAPTPAATTPVVPVTATAPVAAAPAPRTPAPFTPITTTAEPPGPRPNPAIMPVIQRGSDAKHQSYVALAQQGNIDVMFMGDSITDFWHTRGKAVWDQYYGNLKAANFGINADRTQNVLWRLQNGEGQGFSPKVVVLMIGTNNTGVLSRNPRDFPSAWRNTNAEAIEGVTADVTELRKDFPDAKIILLSIFPRGDDVLAMQQIPEINKAIAKLDDQRHIFYLDVTQKFLGPDGQINPDLFMATDHLHPTPAGYVVWAEAMKDTLARFLK